MIIDWLSSPTELSRRVFIKGLGYVSLSFIFSTMLGGCESIIKQIEDRPVRRRLRTGSAEVDGAIAIYKDAVQRMKALPASDPRSWTAQAALHGTVAGGFNFCQHGNNHFFSWHRAYLFYFERICQELTGEKSFGLPYWNWNQNPVMHPAFTDNASPLFHPRNNTSVAGNPAFSDSTLNPIFADNNFFTFSAQVEGTPHNTLHVAVGRDMVTGGSPQDPVFWMHHCMVDYCWAKWNIELENDNTNDASWTGISWNHFVDGKGASVNVTAGATILMPLLSYRYEPSTIGRFSATRDLRAASTAEFKQLEKRLKEGADVRFDVKKRVPIAKGARLSIARPFSAEARVPADDVSSLMESTGREERVFVNIESAELPEANDFYIRVFVNLPGANPQTPTTDIHFAGSFAFFGRHMDAEGTRRGRTDFLVNVTETLQRLRQQGQLRAGEPIQIQLVAVPATEAFIRPEADFTLKSIDLVVTPVVIHQK
jgi:tyrosinase